VTKTDNQGDRAADARALLILDLDETLIHCTGQQIDEAPHFTAGGYVGYRRPYLDEFFDRLAEHYRFAIWSAAGGTYVAEVFAAAMPGADSRNDPRSDAMDAMTRPSVGRDDTIQFTS